MTELTTIFLNILEPYKELVESHLFENIQDLGQKTLLREACDYALRTGGKRFRPALVFMIAKGLGYGVDVSQAALGIEYFHTASLIADDLPCMDNDEERRNQQTVHKKFGESVALLSTYALIAAGYRCIVNNTRALINSAHPLAHQSDHLCVLAIENATHNTGIQGATGGQLLDLFPPDQSIETLFEVIDKKTVSLFEISFVFGWIFGGGDLSKLKTVKQSAAHFGRAFQIADDLEDQEQDTLNRSSVNIANRLGTNQALELFHREIKDFEQTLQELSFHSKDLQALASLIVQRVDQCTQSCVKL